MIITAISIVKLVLKVNDINQLIDNVSNLTQIK